MTGLSSNSVGLYSSTADVEIRDPVYLSHATWLAHHDRVGRRRPTDVRHHARKALRDFCVDDGLDVPQVVRHRRGIVLAGDAHGPVRAPKSSGDSVVRAGGETPVVDAPVRTIDTGVFTQG
jgi:hypothetical protein